MAQNEHGFIVRSFNDTKGLLNFADVSENMSKKEKGELKPGACVKTYVLWSKRNSGLALTLDKKKIKMTDASTDLEKSLSTYLPQTEEEFTQITEMYNQLVKNSASVCLGKTFTWKVAEIRSNYSILKTVLEKKAKIAILPKPMMSMFGLSLPTDMEDFTMEGFCFQEVNKIPVVTFNPMVSKLQNLIASQQSDFIPNKASLGFIESISATLGL